ncbi:MAG TPA: efflux transporter outer membrane subunit [Xanthobacteraceae bacterium]|nr:efflux transporter outer membrane subunit [Xanthobacteraceae bacterium]
MALTLFLAACTVGPNYIPAAAPVPTTFKELKGAPLKGWKVATPGVGPGLGEWWVLYKDPKLNFLIKQVEVSNQTVAADAAAYEEARAVIREAQSSLFPVLTGSYTYTRTRTGPKAVGLQSGGSRLGGVGAIYTTTFVPQLNGTWDLDVWGKVRRQVESNTSAAQASKADLDYATLSEQALLATAYFNLRTEDALHDLLERTVTEYKRTLNIVQNQFKAGYSVTAGDVATARANVETTEASVFAADAQRAQFEHAIAMLTGRPPAELTIARHDLSGSIPKIPVGLPSTLLERRPDIAAVERTMQEQNALIGVAVAGYFPDITLSGTLEWVGRNPLPFSTANEIWSLGAAGTQTIFNGGLTAAQVDAARAVYWQSVANYRQTVLTAFQGVEDELSNIRLMTQQLAIQRQAVKDARTAVDVYLNQFQAGTIAFTTVVTAELTLLADEETELTIRQDLFLASVTLIEDLGGGWDTTLLPTLKELQGSFSLLQKLPAD